ncbi:transposase [Clostridium sp. 3-3]|uniref:transposase family protein n=1 Tax=Clostridium sp. 3-3 TaxID=2070757 RepID=UPI000CDAB05D|nr:transposase [Clostridium sp. 3-3]POO88225.1 hypothetical protein C1H59_02100 [Clostridium sp. 3-3]
MPCCNNTNVIRKGSSGHRRVRHLPLRGNIILLLPKIRLYCKDCMLNFTFKYSFIDGKSLNISEVDVALKTFENWKQKIINYDLYRFINAPVENRNNKIKSIK